MVFLNYVSYGLFWDVETEPVATDLHYDGGADRRATGGRATGTGGAGRAGVGETGRRDETAAPAGPRRRAGRQAGVNQRARQRAKARKQKAAGVGGPAPSAS